MSKVITDDAWLKELLDTMDLADAITGSHLDTIYFGAFDDLEPEIAFENAIRQQNDDQIAQMAFYYRHDEDALVSFFQIALELDAAPAAVVVSILLGSTYGDDAFSMLLDPVPF